MDDAPQPLTAHDLARIQAANGDWLTFAGDDRLRPQMAAYLANTGRHEELFGLVAESDAWAEARCAAEGNYAGYLADLDLAWQWCESEAGWNVGRQFRCALIHASLRRPPAEISAALLAQAVEVGRWNPAQALAHARQIPDEFSRAEAIIKLAPLLPDELKAGALGVVQAIVNEYARAHALGELVAYLPQALKTEAFEAVRSIHNEAVQAMTMGGMALLLPDELQADALSMAWQAGIAQAGQTPGALNEQLSHLADSISAEAVADTLQAAARQDEDAASDALSLLSPRLPDLLQSVASTAEAAKTEALAEALQSACDLADEHDRADALIGLIPLLTDILKPEAVRAACALTGAAARAHALIGMLPYVLEAAKPEVLDGAWQAGYAISDGATRAEALSRLAIHLPDELKAQTLAHALAAARADPDIDGRARALARVAPRLPDGLQPQVLAEAVQAAHTMSTAQASADTLSQLAAYLPGELKARVVGDALQAARAIGDQGARSRALNALVVFEAEVLGSADPDERRKIWRETLREMAGQRRPELLDAVAAMLPVVHELGGAEAAREIERAIRDTARWWP